MTLQINYERGNFLKSYKRMVEHHNGLSEISDIKYQKSEFQNIRDKKIKNSKCLSENIAKDKSENEEIRVGQLYQLNLDTV